MDRTDVPPSERNGGGGRFARRTVTVSALTSLWKAAGWSLTGLGAIGIVLPLVPTTPFLILAAAAFARGDPRVRDWLVGHAAFGPTIQAWQRHRAIPRNAKRAAYVAMAASLALAIAFSAPVAAVAAQAACLALAALFIATRPDASRQSAGAPPRR